MPQFLLTADEYHALVPRADLEKATEALRKMAPLVARSEPKQRFCIHDRVGDYHHGYCDYCPAADLGCPLPKNWSK